MDKRIKMPELVSPAGNFEKLKIAFAFGADAAYLGGPLFSLRKQADNFSFSDLKKASHLADSMKKRIYLAVNSYFFDNDLKQLSGFLKKVKSAGIKTLIISDMGVLARVREKFPSFRIHLSTQANVTNASAVQVYKKLGVSRIVLARELNLKQISGIICENPGMEFETFVHGAMCISYSGRCLLSDYFTGRSANSGDCAQSCRWEYDMIERKRPNEVIPIEQDGRGTYILSSKDLNMAAHIGELAKAGISALKIEGRMKSLYYAAVATGVYRRSIDAFRNGEKVSADFLDELEHVSHRPYHTGFYYAKPSSIAADGTRDKGNYIREYMFLGVAGKTNKTGFTSILLKNPFKPSDNVEILRPDFTFFHPTGLKIFKRIEETNSFEETDMARVQTDCLIRINEKIPEFSILRLRQ